jgi:hypothetical protein
MLCHDFEKPLGHELLQINKKSNRSWLRLIVVSGGGVTIKVDVIIFVTGAGVIIRVEVTVADWVVLTVIVVGTLVVIL